jgi:uncharacterized protein with PIN domain
MKVLDDPSSKPWTHESTCMECRTRVELEISDFTERLSDQRDGTAVAYKCPTCGRKNWVDTKLFPAHVHHRLPR